MPQSFYLVLCLCAQYLNFPPKTSKTTNGRKLHPSNLVRIHISLSCKNTDILFMMHILSCFRVSKNHCECSVDILRHPWIRAYCLLYCCACHSYLSIVNVFFQTYTLNVLHNTHIKPTLLHIFIKKHSNSWDKTR